MSERENTAPEAPLRDERGHFLPGASGNPGGRSAANKYISELAREALKGGKSGCLAIDALVVALDDPDHRVAAAKVLMGYAYGLPRDVPREDQRRAATAIALKLNDDGPPPETIN